MALSPGDDWGDLAVLPPDAVMVGDDGEARTVVESARSQGRPPPPIALLGGDLCRTLGGRGDAHRLRTEEVTRVHVDIGSALLDGRQYWFVAHLVARRSWLRGRVLMAMNAEWHGTWDVAPRAHPGDGRLDIIDADPGLRERGQIRSRLPTGTHLPHPAIQTRQAKTFQASFDRPMRIWLDRQAMPAVSQLSVRVEPGALETYV